MSKERASWPMKSHEVLAILDGRKTQHWVPVKPQPPVGHKFQGWQICSTGSQKDNGKAVWAAGEGALMHDVVRLRSPYGRTGDVIWGREDTYKRPLLGIISGEAIKGHDCGAYTADGSDVLTKDDFDIAWWGNNESCPAMFMPKYASRIKLEITNVRLERLQDICTSDALSEGVQHIPVNNPCAEYKSIREVICGAGLWDENPWFWVYEFRKF